MSLYNVTDLLQLTIAGLFVPSLDVSHRRRNFTYFHCLAVLEQTFSRQTVTADVWLRVMVLR